MSNGQNNDVLPPAVFLLGPTASGKTDLAIELRERFPLDIISVDSAMIYRDMNIGTAKPDAEVLARAPHRLIDIINPDEAYSVARFREDALAEMRDIQKSGRIPLFVGGTMMYFRALEYGLSDLPETDGVTRQILEQRAQAEGLSNLHNELATFDPAAAARIHPNDPQRILRALEVCITSGQSLSSLQAEGRGETLPYRILKLVLCPEDRSVLHQRIEQRFINMLERGFIGEVEALRKKYLLNNEMSSMRCVGYRQVCEYLDKGLKYKEMLERGVIATRQLAKRQVTWLRKEQSAHWLKGETIDINAVAALLQSYFA